MFRAFRRFWFWLTHRHQWEVIWRDTFTSHFYNGITAEEFGSIESPLIVERCCCGKERARTYRNCHWEHVDLDFVNDSLVRRGIELPARHQE